MFSIKTSDCFIVYKNHIFIELNRFNNIFNYFSDVIRTI
jgi:hypothetical protein